MQAYQRVVAIDPDYGDAHVRLGDLYAATGRPAEARIEYERAKTLGVADSVLAARFRRLERGRGR